MNRIDIGGQHDPVPAEAPYVRLLLFAHGSHRRPHFPCSVMSGWAHCPIIPNELLNETVYGLLPVEFRSESAE
jgi:hypothetical protein